MKAKFGAFQCNQQADIEDLLRKGSELRHDVDGDYGWSSLDSVVGDARTTGAPPESVPREGRAATHSYYESDDDFFESARKLVGDDDDDDEEDGDGDGAPDGDEGDEYAENNEGKLCENCRMDYGSEANVNFSKTFQRARDSSPEQSLEGAKAKIVRIFALGALVAVVAIVASTLGCFFAIRSG